MTVKGIVKNGIITPVEKVYLKENQEVLIVTDYTEIKKNYSLDELLDGVDEENIHAEIDTDKLVGKELW